MDLGLELRNWAFGIAYHFLVLGRLDHASEVGSVPGEIVEQRFDDPSFCDIGWLS